VLWFVTFALCNPIRLVAISKMSRSSDRHAPGIALPLLEREVFVSVATRALLNAWGGKLNRNCVRHALR
jgi:hypothetical protein